MSDIPKEDLDANGNVIAPQPGQKYGGFGSWIDSTLDLDPRQSFTESMLNGLIGPDTPAHGKDGDTQLDTLGRAAYSVAMVPAVGLAAAGGELLDTVAGDPLHLNQVRDEQQKDEYEAWHEQQLQQQQQQQEQDQKDDQQTAAENEQWQGPQQQDPQEAQQQAQQQEQFPWLAQPPPALEQ